ncbi:MAG: DUF937 domain-containing protein [Gammaproteobacteria bacterium]|nr:DUF937 domain-containing protein [Gammaproteobacteria bacterium]MBT8110943.1 DUF937 domain-containing protein [Gammaproteobacteria bacterium]NND47376.1 DUF937 domain-containing protein [Woeseiaceae bacterium]NNL45641.1 DUF937 domain-containing protein [Woeseiaceae bacterium]
MDIKSLATQLIMSKIGGANDSGAAASALDDLAGGSDGFDLGDIVGKFNGAGGDLASKAKSWLGDGANDAISPAQLQDAIGSDKIEAFASKLGIGKEEASSSLSQILPDLIDKSSQGGNLLGSLGGAKGLASKFFK